MLMFSIILAIQDWFEERRYKRFLVDRLRYEFDYKFYIDSCGCDDKYHEFEKDVL